MALENSQTGVIYLSVLSGKITRKVPAGTPDAVQRENKNGKVVHELQYDKLTGTLVNIEFRDGDYGKEIHFVLRDGADTYRLQQQFSSGVAKSIIMRLPNADITKPITVHTGWDVEKERTFSYITQDDNVVKSAFTKDEPNGMPQMKKIKVKGKDTWDDSDQLEFLEKLIGDKILPQIKKTNESITPEQPDLEDTGIDSDTDDQLPF